MPWKESTTMEQKIDPMAIGFICEWRTGKYSITELCRAFGISQSDGVSTDRQTMKTYGIEGLLEQSRAPQ
jgi:hypothetical protein